MINNSVKIENKKVKCDTYLQTSNENIFSAGDVCSFPFIGTGERVYQYLI